MKENVLNAPNVIFFWKSLQKKVRGEICLKNAGLSLWEGGFLFKDCDLLLFSHTHNWVTSSIIFIFLKVFSIHIYNLSLNARYFLNSIRLYHFPRTNFSELKTSTRSPVMRFSGVSRPPSAGRKSPLKSFKLHGEKTFRGGKVLIKVKIWAPSCRQQTFASRGGRRWRQKDMTDFGNARAAGKCS